MSEQQNGASPAVAGAAPAPDLKALCAALKPAFDELRKVIDPLPPFELRPVLGEPAVNMDGDEDGNEWPDSVGWSLSLGCQLTFGRDGETGEATAQVSMSDMDLRRGITKRTAKREQVAAFGRMLVEQFGERPGPDHRDQRVQLRVELARIRSRLAVELNRKPSENTGVPTEDLVEDMAGRWRTAVTYQRRSEEELRKARETVISVCAERDRLRAQLDQHLADENSAQAANDRLRNQIQSITTAQCAAIDHITNRLSDILDADTTDIHELLNMVALRVEDDAAGHSWACLNPACPDNTAWAGPSTCTCGDELSEIDHDGHPVQP